MTLNPVSSGDPHVPAHNAERDAINALELEVAQKITLPPGAQTGDLLRWDGTQWLTTETRMFEGNGNPNGLIAAPVGSRYVDKNATHGAVEWIKNGGGDSNTGWMTLVGDSGWLKVGTSGNSPFLNGWANYPTGDWADAAYRKINGIVFLKGLLTRASSRNIAMFQLPIGFRPFESMHFGTLTQNVSDSDYLGIHIGTTGMVSGRAIGGGWVSVDGVSFPADR